jgi:hypothetical protein
MGPLQLSVFKTVSFDLLRIPYTSCVHLSAACQAVERRTLEHSWRIRAEAAEAALEQARVDMADIRADITRQTASLQVHAH